MINFQDIIKIFTLSESDQAQYFPLLTEPLFIAVGGIEMETEHSRMIALCTLNYYAKSNEGLQDELGHICFEITALSDLMIEVSGIYEWLVMHPEQVEKLREIAVVDSSIYGVWCIIRRLCKFVEEKSQRKGCLKPFEELFSEIIMT